MMIILSNICIMAIVLVCLLWVSTYTVSCHSTSRKVTLKETIAIMILFLLLTGAIIPRLAIWLF